MIEREKERRVGQFSKKIKIKKSSERESGRVRDRERKGELGRVRESKGEFRES